jgi:hypothetical protein
MLNAPLFWGDDECPVADKTAFAGREFPTLRTSCHAGQMGCAIKTASGCSVAGKPKRSNKLVDEAQGFMSRSHEFVAYFTALTPAVAATPFCWPVPPLTPMAPTILPSTMIGRPPSEAVGRASSGKVMKATLPAAN